MADAREMDVVCRRVIYSGRVQGVGFRYTTHAIARRHPVSGYVRNRSDGSVELEAQGTATAVDEFLSEVSRRFQGHIANREIADLPATEAGNADGFSIRY
jgi:acylphosphatase